MSPTRNLSFALAAAALLASAVGVGFYWGHSRAASAPLRNESPGTEAVMATVRVVPMQQGHLNGTLEAFGSIVPAPGASRTLSVAYESRVLSIAVREGEAVAAGTPLMVLGGSPDAQLALSQARIDATAAAALLEQTQARHALKLADNGQLAQAQQAYDSALAKVSSLEARNLEKSHTLKADAPGIVVKLGVVSGMVAAPGTALMDLVDGGHLEARLGLEPNEASRLRPGSFVNLASVEGGSPVPLVASVRTVSPAINPSTRLRDVYVALPAHHPFTLGQYVHAKVGAGGKQGPGGFIVPSAAVLPEDGRQVMYTVRKGHAVRHEVTLARQEGDRAQVEGQDLDPGEPVVVMGNYELQDGMAVRIEQAP